MGDLAITARGLGKQYKLGQRESYRLLRDVIAGAAYAPLRRVISPGGEGPQRKRREKIWALDDVTFDIREGEVVGVIGRNGAGKTTLLKILSRITEPTTGSVELRGRVGSLLEVGTGFHPELTGRENIYLNGAILGMRKTEIDRKFAEITEFSGIERFLDTPVKRYSSGMYVRLAFAVAAHLEPEILLVDEVLAVGDVEFQRKCLGKMRDVTSHGRAVIFVSHNMAAIRGLCERVILIDGGRIVFDGEVEEGISRYLEQRGAGAAIVQEEDLDHRVEGLVRSNDRILRCLELAVLDSEGRPCSAFSSQQEIELAITYECLQPVPNLLINFDLEDTGAQILLRAENRDQPSAGHYFLEPGVYRSTCRLPAGLFGQRRFYLTAHLIYEGVEHLSFRQILTFDVRYDAPQNNFAQGNTGAYFRPQLPWSTELVEPSRIPSPQA